MEKKFVLLLCLVCLCRFETGWSQSESWSRYQKYGKGDNNIKSIIGGKDTKPGGYPFMIALEIKDEIGTHGCGGSILNERWIISAAHCMLSNDPGNYTAYAGLHKMRNKAKSQKLQISEFFIHNYKPRGHHENDIALLRTSKPIDMSGTRWNVKSIRLPTMKEDPTGFAMVIGWGYKREKGHAANVLQEAFVEMVDRNVCMKKYPYLKESMICAGPNGKAACKGDSGGPLFQYGSDGKPTLIGITSFSIGCGRPGIPTVFTKVSSYKDWIKRIASI